MYGMLSRAPGNLPPLVTIQALNSTSSSFESHKRLCKSWPSSTRSDLPFEPTSVLDIRSPSPTSTLSSSFAGSSSCEGTGLGGLSTSEKGAVAVSSLFTEAAAAEAAAAAAADHGGRLPDCRSLLETEDGSVWKDEEDNYDESATEDDNGIIAAVSRWSADMEMEGDPSCLWGERGAHSGGISGIVGARNISGEGSSSRITDMLSGGNVMAVVTAGTSHPSVAVQQQQQQQQQQIQGDGRGSGGANLQKFVQKMDPFSFAVPATKKMNGVSGDIRKQHGNINKNNEVKKEMVESYVVPLKVDCNEMQKIKLVRERDVESSTILSSLQCEGGGDDQNMMMQQQQQDQACRSEEWLVDLQSLPGTEFQVEDGEKVPSLAMDDLESMFLTSPPPPPDHSLMKLLFGEVEDPMLLQYHHHHHQQQQQQQQQQLNKSVLGLPQLKDLSGNGQHRQLDLQEAIEAQFSSSGLFCNINSQALVAPSPPPPFRPLPPHLSDSCFPIIPSNPMPNFPPPNISPSSPTFPSNFPTAPPPPFSPFHAADHSTFLSMNRLCHPQHHHLPCVDSSVHPFSSYDRPQPINPRDSGMLPLSYQPNISPNFSAGCPSFEKRVSVPPQLPPPSMFSSSNPPYNSLPTYSVGPYTRVQKVMVDKLPSPHLQFQAARPSFPLPSFGGYVQPEFSQQQKRIHGSSQDNELPHKTTPWQLKPEPGWQAAMAKNVEDPFRRVVKQELHQQMRSPQAQDSRLLSMNRRDIQFPELQKLSQWVQRGKLGGDEIDQLLKAAEAVELGNTAMAQAILARLNQHLSPQGKPLQRAAFHFKEALGKRVAGSGTSFAPPNNNSNTSPLDIVNKVSAYKSFCEFSLLPQFAHFTANQAILEAMEGEDNIHLIDFELGLGGQWASFLQEVALRPGGPPKLKITTVGAESIEMQLTRENLYQFARSLNTSLDFQVISVGRLDNLTAPMFQIDDNEAVAVNFSFGLNHLLAEFSSTDSLTAFLQLVKDLSPNVVTVVDMESECDGSSFFKQFLDSLQFYASLFDSLDATTNLSMETILKIEKLLFAPKIASLVDGRKRNEKLPQWRNLLRGAGFSPLPFSHTAETQADCLIQNPQVCSRGFSVSKNQGSLLLGWQGRALVSACAWSC